MREIHEKGDFDFLTACILPDAAENQSKSN
jgi:hypothetical protein